MLPRVWLVLLLLLAPSSLLADCRACHKDIWPTAAHERTECVDCHRGQAQASEETAAHRGMLASPGQQKGAGCGGADCHQGELKHLGNNRMMKVPGMLAITAKAFGERPAASVEELKNQGHQGYLRKLCVSCHLGSALVSERPRTYWRGGGCLACHLGPKQKGKHRALDLPRSNQRCFGCHSRSGRISMNYAGLAELEASRPGVLRLSDGRPVTKRPADVHSKAGMLCVDCHTTRGVMGDGTLRPRGEQTEINCLDCHDQARKPPFKAKKYGSDLSRLRQKGARRFINLKGRGGLYAVPLVNGAAHPDGDHRRLSCEACHAQWAPQCYGCHVQYEPNKTQWDHLKQAPTPGRWKETGWDYRARLPSLGVYKGRIQPFVPGMNWTLDAPGNQRQASYYAPISPHTTGPARSCRSCHVNPSAWGEVPGRSKAPEGFKGMTRAWQGGSLHQQARPFSEQEAQKIKQVGRCMKCHRPSERIFLNFTKALKQADTVRHRKLSADP